MNILMLDICGQNRNPSGYAFIDHVKGYGFKAGGEDIILFNYLVLKCIVVPCIII